MLGTVLRVIQYLMAAPGDASSVVEIPFIMSGDQIMYNN
jgi:hypothetical protein